MSLDFPYTCPVIDKALEMIKNEIDYYVGEEANDGLYRDIAEHVEEIRKTNEEMRGQADLQIDKLEEELGEVYSTLEDKNEECEGLEDELESLQRAIAIA